MDVWERMATEQKLAFVCAATDLVVQTINNVRSKCAFRLIKLRNMCVTVVDPWTTIAEAAR